MSPDSKITRYFYSKIDHKIVKLLEYETQIANFLKHFWKNLGEILPSSPAMKSNRLHIGLDLIFNPVLFYQSVDALFR